MKQELKTIVLLFLMSLIVSLSVVAQGELKENKRFSFGLNVNSILQLPRISFDYKFSEQYALTVEAKPRLNLIKWGQGFNAANFYNEKVWDTYQLKGFHSNIIIRRISPNLKQWHISPAIEYLYSYKYGKSFYPKIFSKTFYPETYNNKRIHLSAHYYDFYTRSTHSLSIIAFVEKGSLRIYTGVGLSYIEEYEMGYSRTATITRISNEIDTFLGENTFISLYLQMGVRINIFSF